MANTRARIELVRPPRWVFVRFPRGAMFGEPGNTVKQRQVLEAVLEAAKKIDKPGENVELPFRWEAKPMSWRGREITEGP